ncbi:MAG TPA: phosphoenolpyruvate--protein phosphotransferase [Thermoleophilia bacterium]|nr:phosphoenolpyruvate--protein phosphotransferase [Thermoleophilia bacterium]
MVGLVIVSHSVKLAEGVAELAAQMAGPGVRIGAAGGLDDPGALGTDAARVLAAVEDVWTDDGVLVLMDLGSAVLSAELAVDLLEDDRRGKVVLSAAPLVEGTVAAAVAAGLGDPLDAVAAAARDGSAAKRAQLTSPGDAAPAGSEAGAPVAAITQGPALTAKTARVAVRNRLGLHARPAALLVRTLAAFDASVALTVPASGKGPADARSLTAVGALGVRCGDELQASASGPEAAEALDALRRLADQGFGEPDDLVAVAATGRRPGPASRGSAAPVPEATEAPAPEPPAEGAVLAGVPASPGLALGPARALCRAGPVLPASPALAPTAEWAALEAALAVTADDLRRSRASVADRGASTGAGIFDAHLLLLEDPGLLDPVREAVFSAGETAARAWAAAVERAAAAWDALDDPYQRARAADVRHVGDQVLRHLTTAVGAPATTTPAPKAKAKARTDDVGAPDGSAAPVIVLADELSPTDVAAFAPEAVAGVACAAGGPTAHAVILARALDLPVVVGAGPSLLAVADGTQLIVDGDAGTVTVGPSEKAAAAAGELREARAREAANAASLAAGPAVTRDGVTILVEANVSRPAEVRQAVASGADGVGLLRTEFLFLDAGVLPGEDAQAAAYEACAAALDGRPLTIRTLDAGADKPLPYLPLPPEQNPFLGVRGLRLSLLHPEQLRCQLRAALRAAAAHPVRVMFPMVAEPDELRWALRLLDEEREALAARGVAVPERLETGVMLEIPSAALLAERLAPLVGFFSVGTNDLTQYTLAAERGNAGVAALADPLHPAVLRLIGRACEAADAADRAVAVCGEAAGDPAAVPLLLGLGARELSMSAVRIAAAKQAVRRTDLAAARALAAEAVAADSAAAVRALLAAAASAR